MTAARVYAIIKEPALRTFLRKEVFVMEHVLALLISVEAGLLVELIRRWLDGNDR